MQMLISRKNKSDLLLLNHLNCNISRSILYGYRYRRKVIMHEENFPILPSYKPGRVPIRKTFKHGKKYERLPGETHTDRRLRLAYEELLNVPEQGVHVTRKPYNLDVFPRSLTKKRLNHLRSFGRIPGVIQERKKPNETNTKISISAVEFIEMLRIVKPTYLYNQLFNLRVVGFSDKIIQAYPNKFQMTSVKKHPLHIQFTRFVPYGKNRIRMPIFFANSDLNPTLVESNLDVDVYRDEVVCEWYGGENLPAYIYVDLTNVAPKQLIRVGDLILPDGLKIADPKQERFEVIRIRDDTKFVWNAEDEEDEW